MSAKVLREFFFSSDRAYPDLVRAQAYCFCWKTGCKSRMDKTGRRIIRAVMRDAAKRAVEGARIEAERQARRVTS